MCPAVGGDQAAGIRSADSCLASKENAPSRSRLRPTHPIDLRRSDCRAGEPSTSGAPCSVHSETYWPIWLTSSTCSRQCVANCDNRVRLSIHSRNSVHAKAHRGGGSLVRPPNRPPPKRLSVGGPSTSGAPSSVHTGHYGPVPRPSSGNRSRKTHFAVFSLRAARFCVSTPVLYKRKDQGFAEPGALSSTSPADLPLPRTASREGFVLVASRARRSGNLRLTEDSRKGI